MICLVFIVLSCLMPFLVNWQRTGAVRILVGIMLSLNAGIVGYSLVKSQILSDLFVSRSNEYASALRHLGPGSILMVSAPPQDSGLPEDVLVLLVVEGNHKYLFAGQDLYVSIDREDATAASIGIISLMVCAAFSAIASNRSLRASKKSVE